MLIANFDPTSLPNLELNQIIAKCEEQTRLFFQERVADDRFCFDLWRRAIVERLPRAWDAIYTRYGSLVAGWVQSHEGFPRCQEEVQYFVNEAFVRLYKAIPAGKFAKFPNLQRLLQFFKSCVHGAIIDHLRRCDDIPVDLDLEQHGKDPIGSPRPDKIVDRELLLKALQKLLEQRIISLQERIIFECYFMNEMMPQAIQALYPDMFGSTRQVSQIKENLLSRLKRQEDLHSLLKELLTLRNDA